MSTIAYIDCSAGIAGDMLLGALIDAGAPLEEIRKGLETMKSIRGEWKLSTSKVWKGPGQIAGIKVHVSSIYQHREAAPPAHIEGSTKVAKQDDDRIVNDNGHHDHSHDHDHVHSHLHDHDHDHGHFHGHGQQPSGQDEAPAVNHSHSHDHNHSHSHDHSHSHGLADGSHDGGEPMRNLDDIKALVMESELSEWTKANSIAVFTLLAEAEAHTHGTTIDQIHFHEVGAIDSIIDTVGCVLAMDLLGVREVYASFVPFSSGTVKCMHGNLPVPPPATLRLMIGVPVCPAPKGARGELVTPTGISLVKALALAFGEPPAFIPTHTGVGAGTKEFPYHANIVRVAIGKKVDLSATQQIYENQYASHAATASKTAPPQSLSIPAFMNKPYDIEDVIILETNLDDINPQVIGFMSEKLLQAKLALDVWTQPIQMKKGRPGVCLRNALQRMILRRDIVPIQYFGTSVAVKAGYYGDKIVNAYPEYEQCKEIALKHNIPLLQVIQEVQALAQKQFQELTK